MPKRYLKRVAVAEFQRAKTHCPQGHPYDAENTKWTKDGRACRTCFRQNEKKRRNTPEGRAKSAARMRKWRREKSNEYQQYRDRRRQHARAWLASLRLACIRCGEAHPAVLDFHHRNPIEKDFQIGYMVQSQRARDLVLAEIAKCDVLCANCHRKYHWEERQTKLV